MTEPDWLAWSRELAATAQIGLTFCDNPYDIERYEAMRTLAVKIMAARTDTPAERIAGLFAGETGYATPKVDVRGAVFDGEGRLLMVRESSDEGRWTLPGGWADVTHTPAENVVKEVREESGYHARIVKLAACWDRTRQGHGPSVFSCVKLFYILALEGGEAATSVETSEVAWFAEDALPTDLSTARTLPHQLCRMFEHWRDAGLPTDLD